MPVKSDDTTVNPVELTDIYVRKILPPRPAESNKATFGKVFTIAGSVNYRGAACLSSAAALRVGAGFVTLACPEAVASSVTAYLPDIVTIPVQADTGSFSAVNARALLHAAGNYAAITAGCGLFSLSGGNDELFVFFARLLEALSESPVPVVFDADALNILSGMSGARLPPSLVLTPHPKELSRLLGLSAEQIQGDRLRYAKEAAVRFNAVVVLKGHRTIVTDGKASYVNSTGCSALAKAGTGDVLAGMISGFCAQGVRPLDAACLSVYLHGLAGELAAEDLTEYGMLASDLLRYVPQAIKKLLASTIMS